MVRSCGGVDPIRLAVWQAVGGCLLSSSAGVCTLPYPALSNDRRVKGCYAWRAYGRWHARPYPLTGGVCCRGWQAQGHCYLPPISHLVLPCLAGARVIAGTRSSHLIGGRWFGTCLAWQVRGGSVCRGPSLTVPQGGGGGSEGGVWATRVHVGVQRARSGTTRVTAVRRAAVAPDVRSNVTQRTCARRPGRVGRSMMSSLPYPAS